MQFIREGKTYTRTNMCTQDQSKVPPSHQWLSGSAFETDRQEVPCLILGRACGPSRWEVFEDFSETLVKTG